MSPQRVTRVSLQADVSGLVKGFQTSAREAGKLNRDVSSLERELERLSRVEAKPNITLVDGEAKARLEQLQAKLAELGRKTADAKVDVNDAAAQTKLSRIEAQLLAVGSQSVDPTIDLQGIAAAEARLGMLETELERFDHSQYEASVNINGTAATTKSFGLLVDSVAMLGPAAVASGAAASGAILGLGTAFTTAGVAGLALGMTISGQTKSLKEQEKLLTAAFKHIGTLTKGSEEYTAAMQSYRMQLKAFHDQFGPLADAVDKAKSAWKSYLTTVGQGGLNQMMGDALQVATDMLPKIEGLVLASSGSVDDLLHRFSDFAKGPEAGAMLAFFEREGPAAIETFGSILGNTGKGLVSLLMAFTPLAHGMAGGLQEISKGFAQWAQNLPETQGFQGFMEYIDRVGPKVWDTLGALAEAFIAIATAAAPVGEATLPIIKTLADMLASIAESPAGPALFGVVAGLAALNRALRTAEAFRELNIVKSLTGGMDQAGNRIEAASKKALAAKGGFLAAGAGLEILSSRVDDSNTELKGFLNVAGGAALGAAFGPWGAALGGAAGLLQTFTQQSQAAADAQRELEASAADVASTLNRNTGNATSSTVDALTKALSGQQIRDAAKALGLSMDTVVAASLNEAGAVAKVDAAQAAAAQSAEDLTHGVIQSGLSYSNNGISVRASTQAIDVNSGAVERAKEMYEPLTTAVDTYGAALKREADRIRITNIVAGQYWAAQAGGVRNTHAMGGAVDDLGNHIDGLSLDQQRAAAHTRDLTQAQKDLKAALQDSSEWLSSQGDWTAYNQAILDATQALKDNGKTLDVRTEKGLENRQALENVAASIQRVESNLHGEKLAAYQKRMLPIFTTLQVGFGKSATEADAYARKVLGIPPKVTTTPDFNNKDANKGLDETQDKANHLGDPRNQPKVKPTADTADALARIQRFSRDVQTSLHNIPNEYVQIAMEAQAEKVMDQLSQGGTPFAYGGAVRGPGGPRDDLIHARLSNGERVQPTEVINKAGGGNNAKGQKVMGAIERMILRGQLGKFGDVPAFADGGPVGSATVIPSVSTSGLASAVGTVEQLFDAITGRISADLSKKANDYYTHLPAQGQLGPGGMLTPAQLVRGQQAANSQVGKPYVWGGVGPYGYDCSGFQSYVLNSAQGYANPYVRRGSTASMPWPGSAPGGGRYSIGWTTDTGNGIGHTSGNIGGLNVESNGSDGVVTGSRALTPVGGYFTGLMHYDQGGEIPANSHGMFRNGLNHSETVIPAPPKYVNAALRAAANGGGMGAAVVKAVNEVAARVAHLEQTLTKGVPVDATLRNLGALDARSRAISRDEVDQAASYASSWSGASS